ncbi:MAG: peptidoglycan-binding protein [Myxococcales bacterium]
MDVRRIITQSDFVDQHTRVRTDEELAISRAVGDGPPARCPNVNADVKRVQRTLNGFRPFDGGPERLLKVDGICGQFTKAAILRFQRKMGSISPDGIVDVEGKTIRLLRLGPPPGNPGDAPAQFLTLLPRVIGILTTAQAALRAARTSLTLPGTLLGASSRVALAKHFVRSSPQSSINTIDQVHRVYTTMTAAIGHLPQGRFIAVDEPETSAQGALMFSFPGGFDLRIDPKTKQTPRFEGLPIDLIYICPSARRLTADAFTYCIIHELAHFVSDTRAIPFIDDVRNAYFHKNPVIYKGLTNFEAMRNADCYSQFAFETIGRPDFRVNR